eukprot:CAMPEP_0185255342 /NCGR_PEP_ID=MMETSP1359-20130426/4361_1 /TAXON_ID=552665 /ORGANISM="Bigelowiella longifila, Strain CCMP242" /LENGTH=425 /DNA_ID=CAMNT_0027839147 /DNA_START=149 /DNA_END=1423 /DNA_ORIENTATION=+
MASEHGWFPMTVVLLLLCYCKSSEGQVAQKMAALQNTYGQSMKALDRGNAAMAHKLLYKALKYCQDSELQGIPEAMKVQIEALISVARLEKQIGAFSKAVSFLKRVLKVDPRHLYVMTELGHIYHKMGPKYSRKCFKAYKKATKLRPDDHHLWYYRADAAYSDGNLKEALYAFKKSLSLLTKQEVPYDQVQGQKTLVWARILDRLGTTQQRIGDVKNALKTFTRGVEIGIWKSPFKRFHHKRLYTVNDTDDSAAVFREKGGVEAATSPSSSLLYPTALVSALKTNFDAIKEEVVKTSLAYEPEPEGLADGSWNVLSLVDIDRSAQKLVWKDGVQEAMPELTAILSNITEFKSCVVVLGVCDAYISRLTPGTHIKPHCGPTNLRIRTHLGIDVPEDCFIRVADSLPSRMSEGGFFVFDDAYEHEVW